ncbi:MAG: hypothetical protein QM495_03620 [Lutibacter sp.]|uniref:hypothetical protein n=1 Tax=Lutibacter sp. TaxID=1925666 RepID=UPI00385F0C73
MKNILNKYIYLSLFLALSLVITSCDDDDLESDASKVVPIVTAINGEVVAFIGDTYTYTLKPYRGGSEYIWSITGAEIQPVEGRKDQINVHFNQFSEPVSLSVYELAFNGKSSDPINTGITVFGTPCDWTIEMQDAFGDGWNGASLSFTFDGFDGGEFTLDDGDELTQKVPVPDGSVVEIKFNSGDWDEEVTFQIYDGNGTLVLDAGPTPTIGTIVSMTNSCN